MTVQNMHGRPRANRGVQICFHQNQSTLSPGWDLSNQAEPSQPQNIIRIWLFHFLQSHYATFTFIELVTCWLTYIAEGSLDIINPSIWKSFPLSPSILPCCWWLIFSSRLNFIFVTGRRGRDRILCSLESEEFFWVVFVALFNTRTRAGGWHEWLTGQDLSIWQGLSQTDAHIGALWGSTALIPSCLLRNVHGRFSRHIC